MKKTLTLFMSMICMLMTANYTAHAVAIDVSSGASWRDYMFVYENDNGAQGEYLFSTPAWYGGMEDLSAIWTGEVLTFFPETRAYSNEDGYWTNSPDGGTTPGPDGNKFMDAQLWRNDSSFSGKTLTFSGTISAFDLDPRYTLTAFIKCYDEVLEDANELPLLLSIDQHFVTSTGSFDLSLHIPTGKIGQIGFAMLGLNANPATDWGSADFSDLSATAVVPEPSTYALIAGLAAFILIAIRRRK